MEKTIMKCPIFGVGGDMTYIGLLSLAVGQQG